jgi:phospholipid transport system substrate-binding protein
MMRGRFVAVAWIALLLCAGASATEAPEQLVRRTAEEMFDALRADREAIAQNPQRIYDLVSDIVLPHFDFQRISRWVLGKHWRRATPEQRARFTEEFRILLVRTYATALNEYTEQKITYLPTQRAAGADEATVRTEVEQPGGFPIPIDYSMYLTKGEWKVYDVSIDGVSLVTNYRTSFSNEIRQQGLDKLIETLAARNRQAAA